MSIPLSLQLFDAFLGSQEGIHSVILPDIYSSGGSKNLWIDKYGRAKRIDGYITQNASPLTTNGGGSAAMFRGLFHYRATVGGSVTRRLIGVLDDAANEWELHYSTDAGVTWTLLEDLGSPSINRIPDFAQFGDDLYITNGVMAPRKLTGTTITTAGATQSPTPTATASASAGNLLGTYRYKLLSMVSGVRQAGSIASASLALQDLQASLTWTADANLSVTGYELYRTTGTGDVFYFVDYVDLRATTAYTDNTADLSILENRILEEHGDPPPSGAYFCEPHKQRMWYFRTDAYPTRGWFSDPGLPESVLTTSNFLEFSDSETVGDICTGSIGNFEGQEVVGTERAIWTISGTGQVIGNIIDWTRTRTNAQTGWVSHRTVAKIPAGSKYTDQNGKPNVTTVVTLAYLTPLGDIRMFDGDNDLVISHPKKTTLATLNYAQRAKFHCLHDESRAEVTWMFAINNSTEPNWGITWNYRWGVWYDREWAFACAVNADDTTHASLLLAGEGLKTTGAYVYQLWSGTSFNGVGFRAQWMTKTLYGVDDQQQPALSHIKRWRWVDLLFETEQTTTLNVEWLSGNTPDNAVAFGSTTASPAALPVLSADGDRLITADGDAIAVAQASSNLLALLQTANGRYLHDVGLRLRIFDEGAHASWSLEGMNLAYQILPGLGRRMN